MKKILKFIWRKARLNRFKFLKKTIDGIHGYARSHVIPFPVKIQGSTMALICWKDFILGAYEPETTNLFKKIIKKGWTVVDIGADYGYYSLLSARLVGQNGKVYAFDPNDNHYEKYFIKNIKRNKLKNIIPFKKALSNKKETRRYFFDSYGFYPDYNSEDHGGHSKEVECNTLDSYFKNEKIDFVKIDVEGAELEILQGMKEILGKNTDIKIVLELWIDKKYQPILDYLENNGFNFFYINEDGSITPLHEKKDLPKYFNIFCQRHK